MSLWQHATYAPKAPKASENGYYKYSWPRLCYRACHSNMFGSFIMSVILINTLMLALDRYPAMPPEQA